MNILQPKAILMHSFPQNYNRNKMNRAGLLDEKGRLSEHYCKLQANYKKLVCDWLLANIDFVEIENQYFGEDWLGAPVEDQKKTIYQYSCDLNTDYIYLRNNYYVEKLSDDELAILKEYVALPNDESCYIKALRMVQRSIEKVISENDDINVKELYKETLDEVVFCPANALVFAARANINSSLADAKTISDYEKQIMDIRNNMQKELRNKICKFINLPVMMFFE